LNSWRPAPLLNLSVRLQQVTPAWVMRRSATDELLGSAWRCAAAAVEQLRFFAAVLKAIRSATDDEVAIFWAFLQYVSSHHPGVLSRVVPSAHAERVAAVYRRVQWPVPAAGSDTVSGRPRFARRWWEFWK
jgi:hypothetical protein